MIDQKFLRDSSKIVTRKKKTHCSRFANKRRKQFVLLQTRSDSKLVLILELRIDLISDIISYAKDNIFTCTLWLCSKTRRKRPIRKNDRMMGWKNESRHNIFIWNKLWRNPLYLLDIQCLQPKPKPDFST